MVDSLGLMALLVMALVSLTVHLTSPSVWSVGRTVALKVSVDIPWVKSPGLINNRASWAMVMLVGGMPSRWALRKTSSALSKTGRVIVQLVNQKLKPIKKNLYILIALNLRYLIDYTQNRDKSQLVKQKLKPIKKFLYLLIALNFRFLHIILENRDKRLCQNYYLFYLFCHNSNQTKSESLCKKDLILLKTGI